MEQFSDLHPRAPNAIDRYAAAKALPFRDDARNQVIPALEDCIGREVEERIALEAAGSAAALGSELGQNKICRFVWDNDERPELRMEAVFILTELGRNPFTREFTREQLNCIVTHPRFDGDELRQAAVWGLGKAGLKSYEDLWPLSTTPMRASLSTPSLRSMSIRRAPSLITLWRDLLDGRPRRAPAASEALRIISSQEVPAGSRRYSRYRSAGGRTGSSQHSAVCRRIWFGHTFGILPCSTGWRRCCSPAGALTGSHPRSLPPASRSC